MSSVRMCDSCGFVFSENAEGWSNMTGNRMVRNTETGKMEAKNASVDYCSDCTEGMSNGAAVTRPQTPAARPRHALTNGEQTQANGGSN
jgi:hypothetical protein